MVDNSTQSYLSIESLSDTHEYQDYNNNKKLNLLVSNKINISSVNELLGGAKQSDVANNYGITKTQGVPV